MPDAGAIGKTALEIDDDLTVLHNGKRTAQIMSISQIGSQRIAALGKA